MKRLNDFVLAFWRGVSRRYLRLSMLNLVREHEFPVVILFRINELDCFGGFVTRVTLFNSQLRRVFPYREAREMASDSFKSVILISRKT